MNDVKQIPGVNTKDEYETRPIKTGRILKGTSDEKPTRK